MTTRFPWLAPVIGVATALIFVAALVASFLAGPRRDAGEVSVTERTFAALSGWANDDPRAALAAFRRSCDALSRLPGDRRIDPQVRGAALQALYGRVVDWRPACAGAENRALDSAETVRAFFETAFVPVRVSDGSAGRVTGYYEIEVRGNRTASAQSTVPVLRPPDDLVAVELGDFREDLKGIRLAGRVRDGRLRPYETRAEIVGGALPTANLALVWLDSAADAFFLHIQGSGRVALPDGKILRIGYAAQNGHPYTAVGRVLVDWGELRREDVTMQSIRRWISQNPDRADTLMNENKSYVFFREIAVSDPALGPLGAQGVQLTPERSIAVDRGFVPLGAPVFLDTTRPDSDPTQPDLRLRQLMVAQDMGGAIKGAERADVFWGFGADAESIAGRMNADGRMTVLVPRALADTYFGRGGN